MELFKIWYLEMEIQAMEFPYSCFIWRQATKLKKVNICILQHLRWFFSSHMAQSLCQHIAAWAMRFSKCNIPISRCFYHLKKTTLGFPCINELRGVLKLKFPILLFQEEPQLLPALPLFPPWSTDTQELPDSQFDPS